jgi:LPS-assembly protein
MSYRQLVALVITFMGLVLPAYSQVAPPDNQILFREDYKDYIRRLKETQKMILTRIPSVDDNSTYFKAPDVEYLQDKNEFIGKGGVIISYSGNQVQGEKGRFNTVTKEGEIEGGLLISSLAGEVSAESGKFNLESGKGSFTDAKIVLDPDGYVMTGDKIEKLSDADYRLTGAELTTCQCADGSKPWSVSSPKIDVEVEGYAKARPFFFECNDVPIFYAPYMFFPVKTQRSSGLLLPQVGYSNQNGFEYSQPIFINVNETTDLTLTPFAETETRYGMSARYTRHLSTRSNIDTKITFSDESRRDGDLRGTQTEDLFDPTFDENRWGGFYRQRWRARPGELPVSLNIDGRYVSDDLYLREINDPLLGLPQDRYLTSRASLMAPIGDYLTGEIGTEFNQSFVSDDDQVFQRLPAATIDGYRTWRIFGSNPYGLKLVTSGGVSAVNYDRDTGYDGSRFEINPKLKVPFYYGGYFSGDFNLGFRQTNYMLDETFDPTTQQDLDDSSDRSLFNSFINLQTILEKVYEAGPDSWLGRTTGSGDKDRNSLQRVKHTIEPFIRYDFVPSENQEDLPLFTPDDRIRQSNMIYYGINSRLIGRFAGQSGVNRSIDELMPDSDPFGFGPQTGGITNPVFTETFFEPSQSIRRIRGERRELAFFGIRQSYDSELDGPDERELSDIATDMSFYPSNYFGFGFNSNFDHEDKNFSSWSLAMKVEDDRGDHLRARFSYIDNSISQVDGNVEVALTDRVKLGFYGRYDDLAGEFVESRTALRFVSSCDCWKVDVGYMDRINPDDQAYTLLLTLKGLGDIGG